MTRRLATKIARNPWAYDTGACARAYRRLYRVEPDEAALPETLAWCLRGPEAVPCGRAAQRRTRVRDRRYEDDATRWRGPMSPHTGGF